jgi:hypothetical protein
MEFFGFDDVMPGNQNERVPRDRAQIPNVRNWAVRDYGNPRWHLADHGGFDPPWHPRQRRAQ